MKCKKGKHEYKIPAFSSIMNVFIKGKMYDVNICKISRDQMLSMDKEIVGLPTHYFAQSRELILWPTPDSNYEIRIYYAPPITEF